MKCRMIDERHITKNLEETVVVNRDILSYFPAGIGEKHEKLPIRTADVPAGNRNEHSPNTSLERYRYANPFGHPPLNL